MKYYAVFLFLVTFTVGTAEIANLFASIDFIPADLIGGAVMLVISATFLRGLFSEHSDAYFSIASLLLALFGFLYLLVLLAVGLDSLLLGEEWNPANDFRPEILLIPLALPGVLLLNRIRAW